MTANQLELSVAAGMLMAPRDNVQTAWGLLRSSDFEEPRAQLVYDALAHAWSGGEESLPAAYEDACELVALCGSVRWRVPVDEAWLAVEYVMREAPWPAPRFVAACEELAAHAALRRVRVQVGEWYVRLSGGGPADYGPREGKDALDTRRVLAGLLSDIRAALRQAQPEKKATSGAVPAIGEW